MTLDATTLIAAGIPLLGLVGQWAVLGYRIRQLEGEREENKIARAAVVALDSKVEAIRTDQGRRLGTVEADTAVLKGKFDGFEKGFSSGRRSRTAAHGHPAAGGGE